MEEAVPIRVHAVDVESIGEIRLPEVLNARAAFGRGLAIRYICIRPVEWGAAILPSIVQTPSLAFSFAAKFLLFYHRKCFAACLCKRVIDLDHCTHVHCTNLSKHPLRNGALIGRRLCP